MGWNKAEILEATGGRIARDSRRTRFGEIVTDSTKVKKGAVFVALKGERHDGHQFVAAAVRRGAACIVSHRPLAKKDLGGVTVIRVGDTLSALGDLAHYRRTRLGPKVLAITGSNGKTTTKEMVFAILEEATLGGKPLQGKVLKTEGNFNNLVGLPLTLLRLRKTDKIAVVELGTNHPGEIQRLAEIAAPDVGIITSVAAAHLEGLNSIAGVAREKGALFQNIRPDGAIAVNLDDPWTSRLAEKFVGKKITYGKRGHVRARSWRLVDTIGMRFKLHAGRQSCNVRLNYVGQHNLINALGATALTLCAGAKLNAVRRGLAKARPLSMRMQSESWRGIGFINDAYNANPASMKAALQTLSEIACSGDRIAVLGDMFELGKFSAKAHRELGETAAKVGIDYLYLLGKQAAQVRSGALHGGMGKERVVVGKDHADLARQLHGRAKRGDWLLFKGSRGMKMEKVIEQFRNGKA